MRSKTMSKKVQSKAKKTAATQDPSDPKLRQKLKKFSKDVLKNFKGGKNVPTGFNGW